LKILVIDDNKSINDMVCSYLNSEGHDVIGVNNGRSGLQMIKQKKFDLIILDLAMPDFSGNDIIDDLSQHELMKDNKIIVLTASEISVSEEDAIIKKGVKLLLRKPINPDELIMHVSSLNTKYAD